MKSLMNKMNFAALALVIGATSLAGTASAQDNRYGHDDHGRDGHGGPAKVVVVEHPVVVRQPVVVVARPVVVERPVVVQQTVVRRGGLFDRLDINNNGAVSKWEFTQRYGNGRTAMMTFRQLDVNRSGSLSVQEVHAGHALIRGLPHRA